MLEKFRIILFSIYKALKVRGLRDTLAMIVIAVLDEREDKKSGVLAHDFLDPKKTDPNASNIQFANFYQPVRSKPFRKLFKKLPLNKELNFVDIGAGTGKAMILAAEIGFQRIRGVEISGPLCQMAETNFKKFQSKFPKSKFEILHQDAMNFPLDPKDGLFFLNDPFSEEVFKPFIERLKEFSKSVDHELTLIYKNNNLREIPSLESLKKVAQYEEEDYWGNRFQIFYL